MIFKVENLARIKSAKVELKNLTLFVGQNSTHKSYMAHVFYEFYKEVANLKENPRALFRFLNTLTKKLHTQYFKELEYLLSLPNELIEETESYPVNDNDYEEELFTILNISLDFKDKKLVSFLDDLYQQLFIELSKTIDSSFNIQSTILDKISIEGSSFLQEDRELSVIFLDNIDDFSVDKEEIEIRTLNTLIKEMVKKIITYLEDYHAPYYFPASRTGFVLTLDEIYAGIFRDKFRGQVSATRLGEPTIDFIQTFADIKTGKINEPLGLSKWRGSLKISNKKQQKLISFLETNIIKGKIKEHRNEQDYASYYLDINGIELDLHLASSATLETLPFIVFIKNTEDITKSFFVIEEPEAHLHPKAQIEMARFIVMLTNSGAKVLVTTHSDYILNEINNAIKLFQIDAQNDFAISDTKIGAYLFKNTLKETQVEKLEIDKFGIANDNFDEVLDELLERSSILSEKILDEK